MLEENTATNPEFDYDRFELTNMDNSEYKENDLPELAEALHLPERFLLLFSETKRRKPQRCTWEGPFKIRRETTATINVKPLREGGGVRARGWGFEGKIHFFSGRFDRVPLLGGRDI